MHTLLLTSFFLATAQTSNVGSYVPGKVFDRFISIWLENEDFTPASSNPTFQSLTTQGITLTSYYALTHPSQPNYIASISGDTFGLNNDGSVALPSNVSTLVDLLAYRNISWKGYFEDLPLTDISATASGGYVRKHKSPLHILPFHPPPTLSTHLTNFPQFTTDIRRGTLPQYSHLSPNQTNNGHDTTLSFSAHWLHSFLSPLLNNTSFTNRTLIHITFDESARATGPNKIFTLLLGDAIPVSLRGTRDPTFYTHYAVLSTIQANFALPNLGRYDVGANVFSFVADHPGVGYTNHATLPPGVLLDSSYPGYLNSVHKLPVPRPNVELVGVLPKIKEAWGAATGSSPYDGSGRVWDGNVPPAVHEQETAVAVGTKKSGAVGIRLGGGGGPGVVGLVALMVRF